jgi:hypothetical protein
MDRTHAQVIIESHLGLDDSEIALALETLGFQALSTEALDLIAKSQVSRVKAIQSSRPSLFGKADISARSFNHCGTQGGR